MNKLIFRKLFLDILYFFLLSSMAITLIVWVIQGVNFLDIIAEQGHAIKIYLIYSLLNIPKIFSPIIIKSSNSSLHTKFGSGVFKKFF